MSLESVASINRAYLERGDWHVEKLGRGFAWLDTGAHESLMEVAQFVETIEKRQGYKIACLEEIAYNKRWLSADELAKVGYALAKNGYGVYLLDLFGQRIMILVAQPSLHEGATLCFRADKDFFYHV